MKTLPRWSMQSDWAAVVGEYNRRTIDHPSPSNFWISRYELGVKSLHGRFAVADYRRQSSPDNLAVPCEQTSEHIHVRNLSSSERFMDCCGEMNGTRDSWVRIQSPKINWKICEKSINSMDMSPDNELIVVGGDDGTLNIVESATGIVKTRMEGHVGDVLSCRFFPSGEVVLSAGSDLQMKIWSVSDGVSPATLKGHTGGVTDTAIVSRGRNVLSCSRDGSIRLWECASGAVVRSLIDGLGTQVNAMALVNETMVAGPSSLDPREVETEGKTVLACCEDGSFLGFDLGSKEKIFSVKAGTASLETVAHKPGTFQAFLGASNGEISVYDLRNTSKPASCYRRNESPIQSIKVHGEFLYVGAADGSLHKCQWSQMDDPILDTEFITDDQEPINTVALGMGAQHVYASGRSGRIFRFH